MIAHLKPLVIDLEFLTLWWLKRNILKPYRKTAIDIKTNIAHAWSQVIAIGWARNITVIKKDNKAEDVINIDENDLHDILNMWDADQHECYPCTREVFVKSIFSLYRERLNPEDAKVYKGTLPDCLNWCAPTTSVCDSPNPENTGSPGDAEKSASAKCARCDWPSNDGKRRIYCMCGQ
jgi:hypothetical protein